MTVPLAPSRSVGLRHYRRLEHAHGGADPLYPRPLPRRCFAVLRIVSPKRPLPRCATAFGCLGPIGHIGPSVSRRMAESPPLACSFPCRRTPPSSPACVFTTALKLRIDELLPSQAEANQSRRGAFCNAWTLSIDPECAGAIASKISRKSNEAAQDAAIFWTRLRLCLKRIKRPLTAHHPCPIC